MLGDPELPSRGGPERAPRLKWATYTSTLYHRRGQRTRGAGDYLVYTVPLRRTRGSTLIATIVRELADVGFAILTSAVRGQSASHTARMVAPLLLLAPPAYAPVVALLAFMYGGFPWTLALFLAPALAAQRLYGLYQGERRLAADLSTANETLARANLQFAAALIATLDARDRTRPDTRPRSQSILGTSQVEWTCNRRAGARISMRTRARHRQDRTAARIA